MFAVWVCLESRGPWREAGCRTGKEAHWPQTGPGPNPAPLPVQELLARALNVSVN